MEAPYPPIEALLKLYRKDRLDSEFFSENGANAAVRGLSGLSVTDEQIHKIEAMWPDFLDMKDSTPKGQKFTYEELNRYLSGFAHIEPDPDATDGALNIVFEEANEARVLNQYGKINMRDMVAGQLEVVAHDISRIVYDYLYDKIKPNLRAHLIQAGALKQEEPESAKFPPVATIRKIMRDGCFTKTLDKINTHQLANLIRHLSGTAFTDEQVELLFPDRDKMLTHVPRVKALEKITFRALEPIFGPHFILNHSTDPGIGYLLRAAGTNEYAAIPSPIPPEGMNQEQLGYLAAQFHKGVESFFYQRIAFALEDYIKVYGPIEEQENAKKLAEAQRVKDAEHEQKLKEDERRAREIMGDDYDKMEVRRISDKHELWAPKHPEFRVQYPRRGRDFVADLPTIYPSFKKKLGAYEAKLAAFKDEYEIEFVVSPKDVKQTADVKEVTANIRDFDLEDKLKTLCGGSKTPFAKIDDAKLLSWMNAVKARVDAVQQKRNAEFLALQNKGFEVEQPCISKNPERYKIAIRRKGTQEWQFAPTMGSKGLIGSEALTLVRKALKEPAVAAAEEQVLPEGPGTTHKEERQTELLLDNNSLGLLSTKRQETDSWLPFVRMAKMVPSVKRVLLPSVIADFESCGIMPAAGEEQHALLTIDEGLSNSSYAKERRKLLKDATRVRIDKDGNETVLVQGDPKLVIFESPMQDAFYEQVRFWMKQGEEEGKTRAEQLKFIREEIGRNIGENVLYDYCRRYSKHKPVVITDDTNSIVEQMFRSNYGDSEQKLSTRDGIGVGFASTRGFVESVNRAYGPMAAQFFSKICGKSKEREADVSIAKVGVGIQQRGTAIDYDIFTSQFAPPFIAGNGTSGRSELQLVNRLSGHGLAWLNDQGVGNKNSLDAGWKTLVQKHPYMMATSGQNVSSGKY